ncbi:hypothetical protein LJB88_03195 [Erysipelotrichaceae bacterium OttesenSCG-928-M19]|nr:hypothetical protein [Erysipelotrichaceae bacterium OttesenSCG-928-M19]
MSFNPGLASNFNDTKMRSDKLSPQSGMCSLCDASCIGTCELGLSAIRGKISVYPTNTGDNQVASEKDYPIDYSHFNINGRVFGAEGLSSKIAFPTIFDVNTELVIGKKHPVKLKLPVILPALIKLNWQDYFSGAAMAGVCCVIGEDSHTKDPNLKVTNGLITSFPLLMDIYNSFNKYYHGYGQIILQVNTENDQQGLIEYAIKHCNCEAVEFKFGQSAKGTQPIVRMNDYQAALAKKEIGGYVYPDPQDSEIIKAIEAGEQLNFYYCGAFPMWDEAYFEKRIKDLRAKGIKNIYFKMAGYDSKDIERVLRIAASNDVDLVTFDGAGGGSGYSPCKMMNEWGLPPIMIQKEICKAAVVLEKEGLEMSDIAITGGFSSEDQVYKALAFGAPYIKVVGICRASMAAANSGKNIGELIKADKLPINLKQYGSTITDIFADLPDLRAIYGSEANHFPTGAIGVFSYLNRIKFGVQHFAALNRKFNLSLIDQSDLIPLTAEARNLLK